MTERTLEQLNQTPLSQETKKLLSELGVYLKSDELYLIQYLRTMQQMWQVEMQWNAGYPLTADAAYGVNPLLTNALELTPEQQYQVITNNDPEDEAYLLNLMKASLIWHRTNPAAELEEAMWENKELLTTIFPLTADNLEMQKWTGDETQK